MTGQGKENKKLPVVYPRYNLLCCHFYWWTSCLLFVDIIATYANRNPMLVQKKNAFVGNPPDVSKIGYIERCNRRKGKGGRED